jgi:hypothetical protein
MADKKPMKHQSNREINAPDDESVVEGHSFSGNQTRNDGHDKTGQKDGQPPSPAFPKTRE